MKLHSLSRVCVVVCGLQKLRERLPSDPFEADLLTMADAVANDDGETPCHSTKTDNEGMLTIIIIIGLMPVSMSIKLKRLVLNMVLFMFSFNLKFFFIFAVDETLDTPAPCNLDKNIPLGSGPRRGMTRGGKRHTANHESASTGSKREGGRKSLTDVSSICQRTIFTQTWLKLSCRQAINQFKRSIRKVNAIAARN